MTRLQTLENRLARIENKREDYISSEKVGGKLIRNPKQARFALTATLIKREIRSILN